MSVVDELRELRPYIWKITRMGDEQLSSVGVEVKAWPLLLDVVEAAERVSKGIGPGGILRNARAEQDLDEALAALESAQGAEQRPETGAGA